MTTTSDNVLPFFVSCCITCGKLEIVIISTFAVILSVLSPIALAYYFETLNMFYIIIVISLFMDVTLAVLAVLYFLDRKLRVKIFM